MSNVYEAGGTINDRFFVLKVMKGGGGGRVYLCIDISKSIVCVLKTIQSKLVEQESKDFRRSSVLHLRFGNHPNIVQCYDLVNIEDAPYAIMEYVAGEEGRGAELSDWLKLGALELRTALLFAIDICQGMIHAVQQGLRAHRDLKPDNILIGTGAVAKITDFGLAITEGEEQYSGIGTVFYMAPEQWLHHPQDTRTDIYAMGCIFYEMAVGGKVFFSEDLNELKDMHVNQSPKYPDTLLKEIRAIIERCTAKDSADRYPSFEAVMDALTAVYYDQFHSTPRIHEVQKGTVYDLKIRAMAYYRAGYLADAIADFTVALEMESTNGELYIHRAVVLSELGEKQAAQADVEQALQYQREDVQTHYLAGIVWRNQHEFQQALVYFDQVLLLDPNHLGALANRAVCLNHLDRHAEAVGELTRAIHLNESLPELFYVRGLVYERMKRYEDAVRDFNRAILINPEEAEYFSDRGRMYLYHLKHSRNALNDFDRAIRLNPKKADYVAYRGIAYRRSNLYHEALQDFDQALIMGYSSGDILRERGAIFLLARQYQQALDDLNRAIEVNREESESYHLRGKILMALERNVEAETDFLQGLILAPQDPDSYRARAIFYLQSKKPQQALMDIMQALQICPQDGELHHLRGNILSSLERHSEAVGAYTAAIGLSNLSAVSYNNRGVSQLELQRTREAIQDFMLAIQYSPTMIKPQLNLGVMYESEGRLPEAIGYYNRAAQMGDPAGLERLVQIVARTGLQIILIDPENEMRRAISNADTLTEMRAVVRRFPFMLDDEFDKILPKIFLQKELAELYSKDRIHWLRLAIAEYSATKD